MSDRPQLAAALADRYRIESVLGVGGMATVYLARDLKHDRKVAIKVLRPELAAVLGPERFLREIEISARLNHPHIVPLFDSGAADGFLYYVLPYVEGESLRDRLVREGELPVREAVKILRDVADALTKAHAQQVVHRDIKPDNVLLADHHALVMDFGVAKAITAAGGEHDLTTAGVALGTPAYMAPEQTSGGPGVDHRADVYALGVLAYELLTGRPPFEGDTAQQLLAAHLTEAPAPVTERRPAVPAELAALVMTCLEKRPADRWQSAAEVLERLERLSAISPPAGSMTMAARPPRSWGRWGAGVAVAGAALVAGWFALRPNRVPPPEVQRIAVLPLENLTGAADQEYFAMAMTEAVITNLSRVGLGVLSRQSVQRYAGSSEPLTAIAEALNVDAIVVGSVFRAEPRMRVDVRFVDGRDETQLWSASFDTTLTAANVFDVQGNIAESIAAALELELTTDSRARINARPTENLQALNAVQRGLFYWQSAGSSRDYALSMDSFREAIRLDSMYAEAWSGLAAVQSFVGATGGSDDSARDLQQARLAALRALEIDPRVSQIGGFRVSARALLAYIYAFEWDFAEAERNFRRVIDELGEDLVGPYHIFLAMVGRHEEARRAAEARLADDPLNPFIRQNLIAVLWWGREFEEALAHTRMLPPGPQRQWLEAALDLRIGRLEEGLAALDTFYLAPERYTTGPGQLAAALAISQAIAVTTRAGRTADAQRHFAQFRRMFGPEERPTMIWATAYLGAGDERNALRLLRDGLERREGQIAWIAQMSEFDALRGNPEFEAIVEAIGVPSPDRVGR